MEVAPPSVQRRNLAVLIAAQAFLGAQLPLVMTIGGLAGQQLAPHPCFATLPIALMTLGSMLTATPLSSFMQRYGRQAGFLVGAAGGATGGAFGAWGLITNSFTLFLIGSLLTGIYMSAQGFFRFAATDTASEAFKPKAISYVLAAGLLSAIIGPTLVKLTATEMVVPFLGSYLAVVAINLVGALLFFGLTIPKPVATAESQSGRTRRQLLADPRILVAIICGMVSYALMTLVMTSTPLAVVGCGFTQNNAADVVTAHVLAMFAPSFFTGHLIVRFGAEKIVATGLVILAGAGAIALAGTELTNFFGALILLGLGWNFGFIGATSMLATAHSPEERGRVQGMNDMIVFGCVTVASVSSGGLMNCSGGTAVQGWTAVNIAMVPFLLLAGFALLWLMFGKRRPTPAE